MEDRGRKVFVRTELSGFEATDVDVQLHDNLLTIRAEKQQEDGQERRSRSFKSGKTNPLAIHNGSALKKVKNHKG